MIQNGLNMLKIKKISKNILLYMFCFICVSCGETNYEARTRYRRNDINYYKNRRFSDDCACCYACINGSMDYNIDNYEQQDNRYNNTNDYDNKNYYKKPKNYTGYYKIGNPYEINGKTYYPKENRNYKEIGLASWYGKEFHNKKTANSEIFNMYEVTAAHKTLPLPSIVRVTNLENGKSIVVRVNDRGPFVDGRIIDLSYMAAKKLDAMHEKKGLIRVKVEYLDKETKKMLNEYGLK